jgi:hypothetical protein
MGNARIQTRSTSLCISLTKAMAKRVGLLKEVGQCKEIPMIIQLIGLSSKFRNLAN